MIARLVTDKAGAPAVSDIAGFDHFQADVAKRLSRYPDIPLGYSNPNRWTQIEAGMLGAGVLERSADLTSFVYSPAVEPTRDNGIYGGVYGGFYRLATVAAAIAVGVAVLTGAVWYGWQFWRRRAARPAAGETEAEPPRRLELPPTPVFALRRAAPAPPPTPSPAPPPPPPLPPPTDLNAVLAPLERRVRQRVRGKVRFRFSLLPGLWPCRTEGGAVAAAVLDLVSAATAAMDADGTLIIGTRNFTFDTISIADYPGARIGQFARITVRDNGPGLTDSEFTRIADPDATTRPAIAKAAAVMERLGGFLRVESAEEVGTAVHLYFARVSDANEASETAPTSPKPAAQVAE
jgi:hypothetical protein